MMMGGEGPEAVDENGSLEMTNQKTKTPQCGEQDPRESESITAFKMLQLGKKLGFDIGFTRFT